MLKAGKNEGLRPSPLVPVVQWLGLPIPETKTLLPATARCCLLQAAAYCSLPPKSNLLTPHVAHAQQSLPGEKAQGPPPLPQALPLGVS